MSKVKFQYDFKKDAWSWVLMAKIQEVWGLNWKDQVAFIPDELLRKITKRRREPAESLVYNYLISHPKKKIRQLVIKEELSGLEKSWRKIESKFFRRLKKIIGKPVFAREFKCYLTTGFMCPYDPEDNSFMVSMWHGVARSITTICHEILHLQFLHYYEKYCRKFISEKKLDNLKETLTFILNSDFSDLLLYEDKGYPNHQKIRERLRKIWEKDKNFGRFLDKAIKITQKQR